MLPRSSPRTLTHWPTTALSSIATVSPCQKTIHPCSLERLTSVAPQHHRCQTSIGIARQPVDRSSLAGPFFHRPMLHSNYTSSNSTRFQSSLPFSPPACPSTTASTYRASPPTMWTCAGKSSHKSSRRPIRPTAQPGSARATLAMLPRISCPSTAALTFTWDI